ncbi:MAG: single-stranded DNA-binding protein [Chloroflexi bacterium]|nr:single-stranded DNA-binding protein [Chloroflexota bacterium]
MLKATIIGNLGNDPDMRYSSEGRPFLRFNVASNFRARSPEGEWQDRTEWVRVTVFGQRAEQLSQYLRKGSRVYVEGRLEARPWMNNQQQPQAGLEVVASDVEFMSSRADDEARGGGMAPASGMDRDSVPTPRFASPRQPAPPADEGDLEDLPF